MAYKMDPLLEALIMFRLRKFTLAAEKCTVVLNKNPLDEVYVDEIENDEDGIAEAVLDDVKTASVARPGTSFAKPSTAIGGPSQAVRPRTQSGRPVTGMVRPDTRSGRPGTMADALKAPRTAKTARPATSATGRHMRLGTASMITNPDGPFINISRLNFSKYATKPLLAKPLFEYLFYHEGDVRNALQLAALATQACQFEDWFWKVALGKCYHRLGLYRDAEKQFKSALTENNALIDNFLYLAKVYVKLDQPLNALDVYKKALDRFSNDTTLLINTARVHEALNNQTQSVAFYKDVLKQESINVEAIACIGANCFYSDQPEIALRFYRRLLQMGINNAEIFANIGLCCFYSQQFDMAINCMERAAGMADDSTAADIWYNTGLIFLASGDIMNAVQSFKLALTADSMHAESLCNLGVIEMKKGHNEMAKSLMQSAMKYGAHMFEPFYNYGLICYEMGDLQSSYVALQSALKIFPDHSDSVALIKKLKADFISI